MGPLGVIDSHCHLDFEDFQSELPAILKRARDAGVGGMICIGSGRDISSAHGALKIAHQETDVWATVGVHPHDACLITEEDWTTLAVMAKDHKVVGIGEAGLDYHYDISPREIQLQVYRRFVALSRQTGLPLVSHVRDAHGEAQAILREENAGEAGGVIHCFTGGPEEVRKYLDLGQYLSFSGIVTFNNAQAVREAAKITPLDRLLIETDAPYLAPIPHRGKRNEPAFVMETLRFLAQLKNVPSEELARITRENTERLFKFSPAPNQRTSNTVSQG